MIGRARAATGGTFRLEVVETVETRSHCAAVIAWSAERDGRAVEGRELAVFGVSGNRIVSARFHPENIADDRAFWGEAGQGVS
jgi:ribosomal protein L35AE/L33A